MRRCAVALVALIALTPVAGAQQPSAVIARLSTDSTAWQRVLVHVVSTLSARLVEAAVDPSPQPWRIDLPVDEPQRALLDAQLRLILRARSATSADSVVYAIVLGPLRIVGDTARVQFHTSVERRCPSSARSAGWTNDEEIVVPRGPGIVWGAARSHAVMHGDRVGCASLR